MRTLLSNMIVFDDWPDKDRAAWLNAMNADPLGPDDGGGGANWRETTRLFHQDRYGRWLWWLRSRGDLDGNVEPGERATRERLGAYRSALTLAGYADYTITGRIQAVGDSLRVMSPHVDTSFVGIGASHLSRRARRKANLKARMRPPAEIWRLGIELMAVAEQRGLQQKADLIQFRDGLLIALLVSRPLRMTNLSTICLGAQLTQAGGEWRLQFGGIEMKAGRPFGCHWPAGLASALNTYLERIRPHLFKVSVAHAGPLWGSAEGGALTYAGIAQAVAGRTRRAFGKAINPHLMRHILATDVAETRPEHHADISAMLAHASTHTAEKYYNLAGPYRAAQTYAAVLRAIQRPD